MTDARQRFFDFMSRVNPLTIVFLMCVGFSDPHLRDPGR